jgi:hypothetical protein
MGVLKNFEGRLERGIEGFFTKAFRSGLHPVEIAKRILREMEAQKTVGVKEVWVPNRYLLRVSKEDRDRFANMENALVRELETAIVEEARENGYGLVARPEVVFETGERLKRGDLRIEAELSEAPGGDAAEPEGKRTEAPADAKAGPAKLVVVDGDGARPEWELDRDRMVIGRLAGSEIEVRDAGASRRHAEVRRQDGGWVVADLGSTNGTLVNESKITEHTLKEGDRITIGRTVLEFRRA